MRNAGAALLLAATALLSAPHAAAAPLECGTLNGAVVDGACQVIEKTPGYTLDLRFPLDYPDEQAIVDYLGQARAGFLNIADDPDTRARPYELDVTAESFRSAHTRSVVLTLFEDVGGAHPTTWYKAFNYDTGRGRPLTLGTLFAPGTDALSAIFPIVQRELGDSSGLSSAIADTDGLDPEHYQNFAITDDALIFYFGRGELLPSYAGATSVSVPRTEIPQLLV